MNDEIKEKLIIDQEIVTIIFIVVLFILLYLLERKKDCKIAHCVNPETKKLAWFNKFLSLFVYLYILYISYTAYKNSNLEADKVALIAAVIAVIPPLILIYAFWLADDENVLNPLL